LLTFLKTNPIFILLIFLLLDDILSL
jgi:hypothetical protein